MIFGLGMKENAFEMTSIMDCPLLKLNKKIESTNVEINFSSLAFSATSGRNTDSLLSVLSNWILFSYFRVRAAERPSHGKLFLSHPIVYFFSVINAYFCHDIISYLYFSLLQPHRNSDRGPKVDILLHHARLHSWQGDAGRRLLNRTRQNACVKSLHLFMWTVHPEKFLISCLMMPIVAAGEQFS